MNDCRWMTRLAEQRSEGYGVLLSTSGAGCHMKCISGFFTFCFLLQPPGRAFPSSASCKSTGHVILNPEAPALLLSCCSRLRSWPIMSGRHIQQPNLRKYEAQPPKICNRFSMSHCIAKCTRSNSPSIPWIRLAHFPSPPESSLLWISAAL